MRTRRPDDALVAPPSDSPGGEDPFLAQLRADVVQSSSTPSAPVLVASYSRAAIGQTGDGHFSPLAAYHAASDSVLVLDVARFKYPPYWVALADLRRAMDPLDHVTGRPRGYFLVDPTSPELITRGHQRDVASDGGGGGSCPMAAVKLSYCPTNRRSERP